MTRAINLLSLVAAAGILSACVVMPTEQPQQLPDQPYNPPIGMAGMTPPAAGSSGLEERQPDLCGAKQYVPYLAQPGSVIPTLGITKEYRIVEYRGIEPQNYVPNRLVFRLDAAGNIQNVDCG